MNCIIKASRLRQSAALCILGVSGYGAVLPAVAEPLPLPYKADPPYIPMIDVFGSPQKGLVITAEEAATGRPVPVTIVNTTFVPSVRRGGQLYGGYTRVRGDLEVVGGDVFVGGQSVGEGLQQLRNDYSQQQVQLNSQGADIQSLKVDTAANAAANAEAMNTLDGAVNQLGQGLEQVRTEQAGQQVQLNQHAGSIQSLKVDMAANAEATKTLGGSVNQLGQGLEQVRTEQAGQQVQLNQHAAAINGLAEDVGQSKQAIAALDQNLTRLGSGVSGATALAAALGSLPVDSQDTPIACGVGTGGYSSRYALAMGCALRLSSALSLNGGGSYLFGGGTDYGAGSFSNVAGRIGLVYRFGASSSGKSAASATAAASEATAATQQLNQQLQAQLQQAEQRQQQLADNLRSLQLRLARLESVARRR